MRDRLVRLGGWVVRGVELLCALYLLLSVWLLGSLAELPRAQQGEGTFAIAAILSGAVAAVGPVVLAGHAVTWLVREPSGDRLVAVADALPRLATEVGVAAFIVWALAGFPLNFTCSSLC